MRWRGDGCGVWFVVEFFCNIFQIKETRTRPGPEARGACRTPLAARGSTGGTQLVPFLRREIPPQRPYLRRDAGGTFPLKTEFVVGGEYTQGQTKYPPGGGVGSRLGGDLHERNRGFSFVSLI